MAVRRVEAGAVVMGMRLSESSFASKSLQGPCRVRWYVGRSLSALEGRVIGLGMR